MIYFTSDLHFGHDAVIEYCQRPFKSLEHMEAALIENWNDTIRAGDDVYVLGDFSLAKPERTLDVLRQLNGNIYLVRGNHDRGAKGRVKGRFVWIKDLYELKVRDERVKGGKQRIVLCHYALLTWPAMHHGAWSLHGHSHGSLRDSPTAKRLDVGVDCHNYRPISYEEVRSIMLTKRFEPVDAHGRPR